MRTEINATNRPPIRPRYTRALGSNSSTHDASRLGCLESAWWAAFRVTHATSEFVARRDTSPRRFASLVALRDTPGQQSDQLRRFEWWQDSHRRLAVQPSKETKYA